MRHAFLFQRFDGRNLRAGNIPPTAKGQPQLRHFVPVFDRQLGDGLAAGHNVAAVGVQQEHAPVTLRDQTFQHVLDHLGVQGAIHANRTVMQMMM